MSEFLTISFLAVGMLTLVGSLIIGFCFRRNWSCSIGGCCCLQCDYAKIENDHQNIYEVSGAVLRLSRWKSVVWSIFSRFCGANKSTCWYGLGSWEYPRAPKWGGMMLFNGLSTTAPEIVLLLTLCGSYDPNASLRLSVELWAGNGDTPHWPIPSRFCIEESEEKRGTATCCGPWCKPCLSTFCIYREEEGKGQGWENYFKGLILNVD